MTFEVRFGIEAEEDLIRLFEFLLGRAETASDLDLARAAIDAIRAAVTNQLSVTPFSFRKAGKSPTRRELVIPFGVTGYVALYEIVDASSVLVLAVRHQREQDYH